MQKIRESFHLLHSLMIIVTNLYKCYNDSIHFAVHKAYMHNAAAETKITHNTRVHATLFHVPFSALFIFFCATVIHLLYWLFLLRYWLLYSYNKMHVYDTKDMKKNLLQSDIKIARLDQTTIIIIKKYSSFRQISNILVWVRSMSR